MALEFITSTILGPVISAGANLLFGSAVGKDDEGESGFVDKDTNIRTRRIERITRQRWEREGQKNIQEEAATFPITKAADTRRRYRVTIDEAFAKAADDNRADMVISSYLAQRKKHNLDNTYGSSVMINDPYSDV
jgi:hypothetical protein